MNDIITLFLNFNYDICLAHEIWTLEEALDYLAAFVANKDSWYATDHAYKAFLRIRDQLCSAVKQNYFTGDLQLIEAHGKQGDYKIDPSALDIKKSTITPLEFISWATRHNIQVPEQFAKYLEKNVSRPPTGNSSMEIKKSTVHHERSRAIAEYLWSMLPHLTINEMARRPEIQKFGCEGKEYDSRTVARWLQTLKADRRPGNPGYA